MKTYNNILYFVNGSIGDFLMTLYLMENIRGNDRSKNLFILTPRNGKMFRELSGAYPHITVVESKQHTFITFCFLKLFQRNCCITPPSPGHIPFVVKVVSRVLSLRGLLIGFDDKTWINKYLYTTVLPFTISRLYHETILQVLAPLNMKKCSESPEFKIKRSAVLLKQSEVTKGNHIVIHPFGSSQIRSILGDDLISLVKTVKNLHPKKKILLSGGPSDVSRIPEEVLPHVSVIAGKRSMSELIALLEYCDLYIGVDTGITHLACMLGTKSVIIAHNGTAHWLPFYNKNATILYQVQGDTSGIHVGRTYLESQRNGRVKFLERVPQTIIDKHMGMLEI